MIYLTRETYRQQVRHTDMFGRVVEYALKAWKYSTDVVFWEARQWLPALFHTVRDTSATGLWRSHHFTWEGFFGLADMNDEAVWLRGRRAKQTNVPQDLQCYVRTEDCCSTSAFLLILCGEAVLGTTLVRRWRAEVMAQSFLGLVVEADFATELWRTVWDDTKGGCDIGVDGHGRCEHLQGFIGLIAVQTPQHRLIKLLEECMKAAPHCKVAHRGLQALTLGVAEHVDGRLETLGWATDNVKHCEHVLAPSGRKRRLDEDFRDEVAKKALRLGHASSMGSFLRVVEGGDSSAAKGILNERLGRYYVVCRKAHVGVERLTVALDGSKLGQPLEETEMYLTWNGDINQSAVGIPQAPAGGSGLCVQRYLVLFARCLAYFLCL